MYRSHFIRNHTLWLTVVMAVALAVGFAVPAQADIIYVNNSLGTNGSGTSPADAFDNIQDALAVSANGDIIWVTGGIYAEGAIDIPADITIAGGFDAPSFADRDISGNPTIIDGQNVPRTVPLVSIVGRTAHLDGLTIANSNNDNLAGLGGGMRIASCSPTITSCTIRDNTVDTDGYMNGGGAVYISGTSSPLFDNCLFKDNYVNGSVTTNGGGGISIEGTTGNVTLRNSVLDGNDGNSNVSGKALSITYSTIDIENCLFINHDGGVMIAQRFGAGVNIVNCTMADNDIHGLNLRDGDTGGYINVTNSILTGFQRTAYLANGPSVLTCTNCLFHDNDDDIYVNLLSGNFVDGGGNISKQAPFFSAPNQRTWPRFTDPSSGDYSLKAGSLAIDNGTASGAPVGDIDGNARVDGNNQNAGTVDIGAYEYQTAGAGWDDSDLGTIFLRPGGTGDGTTWADAMGDPDQADEVVDDITSASVWVAAGIYDVDGTISILDPGKQWVGGFPATGNPGMADRDVDAFETIFDVSDFGDIFYISGPDADGVLIDGFTIQNAEYPVRIDDGYGTIIRNCTLRNNGRGPGVTQNVGPFQLALTATSVCSVTVQSCKFFGNWTDGPASTNGRGGCMYIRPNYGTAQLDFFCLDSVFAANRGDCSASGSGYNAGAISLNWATTPGPVNCHASIRRCVFVGNYSGYRGGAINGVTGWGRGQEIQNCVFVGNWARQPGGAVTDSHSLPFDVSNCTFLNNESVLSAGGGVATLSATSQARLVNSIFSGNFSPTGGDGVNGVITRAYNLFDDDQDDALGTTSYKGDPGFMPSITGSFSASAYDAGTHTTTFTGSGFTPGALEGMVLTPDTSITSACYILSNTATDIVVPGNFAVGGTPSYEIHDLRLAQGSRAIDRGVSSYSTVAIADHDILSNSRPVDGNTLQANAYDLGAYEGPGSGTWAHWYVKPGATGSGASWADACDYDTVIANATNGDIVWFAEGTYPVSTKWDLPSNVSVYGGFPATGDPGMGDRDPDTYSTIDGEMTSRTTALVQALGAGNVLIDGMRFVNASNWGDGSLAAGEPTGSYTAVADGGALYVYETDATIRNCRFENNELWGGGGGDGGAALQIMNTSAYTVTVQDCYFAGNKLLYTETFCGNLGGAGIRMDAGGTLLVDGCRFTRNEGQRGGAMYIWGSTAEVRNSVFDYNEAQQVASIAYIRSRAQVLFTQCTFYRNSYSQHTYGLYVNDYKPGLPPVEVTVLNSIFKENKIALINLPGSGGAPYDTRQNILTVGNCLFDGNSDDLSYVVYDLGGNITTDTDFYASYNASAYTAALLADPDGGDFNLLPGSAAIDAGMTSATISIPNIDIYDNARDVDTVGVGGDGANNAYDIGAVERQSTAIPAGGIAYVNDDAAMNGDGSIGAPFRAIASAAALISTAPPAPWNAWTQAYVAGGAYHSPIQLAQGELRGGFAEDFSSRDLAANETVIDGQKIRRASPMVYINGAGPALIDGFTVKNGRNNYSGAAQGGGIGVLDTDATITSCIVKDNYVESGWGYGGGGIFTKGQGTPCSVLVANTTIDNNICTYDVVGDGNNGGGGFRAIYDVDLTLDNCVITSNTGQRGAGFIVYDAKVLMRNTIVANNVNAYTASAGWLRQGADFTAVNCTFYANRRYDSSSSDAMLYSYNSGTPSKATLVNCVFSNIPGRALYNNASYNDFYVANCVFDNNYQDTYGTMIDLGGNLSKAYFGGNADTVTSVFFTDPANEDFTIKPGSINVDMAVTTDTMPQRDLAGNLRDYDVPGVGSTLPDAGAYELRSSEMPQGIHVDDSADAGGDGSKEFPFQTIQEGIDAATTASPWPNMDQVHVAGGTYPETLQMKGGITVRGGYSADFATRDLATYEAVIDGQGVHRSGRLVYFDSSDAGSRLDGVTVYNNYCTADDGGGIYVAYVDDVAITSCTVDSNRVKGGYLHGGGGIGVVQDSASGYHTLIANCTITSNSTWSDTDSRFDFQYPGTFAGGVLAYRAFVTIQDCRISGNLSSGGSAIGANSSHLIVSNSVIDNNETLENGWNQYALNIYSRYTETTSNDQNPITTVTQCTFYNNTRMGGDSAGDIRTYVYSGGTNPGSPWTTATLVGNIFANSDGPGFVAGVSRQTAYLGYNLFYGQDNPVSFAGTNIDLGGNVSTDWEIGGHRNVFTNPHFVDAAAGDFRLGRGSAAIDRAPAAYGMLGLANDFYGQPRGFDVAGIGDPANTYDLGAAECVSITTGSSAAFYVNDNAVAGGDGSMGAPFQTIAEGLDEANGMWGDQLIVAGGSYYEQVHPTFGVIMKGGYSEDFASRDVEATPSMIDGQNTTRTTGLVYIQTIQQMTMDGFTVQNGLSTSGFGGGIEINSASPSITLCTITGNHTIGVGYMSGGGGVGMRGAPASPYFGNCEIVANTMQQAVSTCGGAGVLINDAGAPVFENCLIADNEASPSGNVGNGVLVYNGSEPLFRNCVIGNNYGASGAGGVAMRSGNTVWFVNCTIDGNEGPGLYLRAGGGNVVTVLNTIISDNSTQAVYAYDETHEVRFQNSVIHGNSALSYEGGSANLTITDLGGNISKYSELGGSAATNTNPNYQTVPGQDYKYLILNGSVAIDAGITSDIVASFDFLGEDRDASPDIGAIEFNATGTSPTILTQPTDVTVDPGDAAAFIVSAMGTPLLSYQWQFNDGSGWVNVGTDSYQLEIASAEEADEGAYRVTITNDFGSVTSDEATLTVNDPPVITVEPVDFHAVGATAQFSVTVTGTAPMTYTWYFNGSALTLDADHVVTSTDTNSTLDISGVDVDDADVGVYRVRVQNSAGSVYSVEVALTKDGPVAIIDQPSTRTASYGGEVTFTAFATGTPPIAYQWYRNGSALSDTGNVSGSATNALTLSPVAWGDGEAQFYVEVSNNGGANTEDSVTVGLRLLPTGVSTWWEMMK